MLSLYNLVYIVVVLFSLVHSLCSSKNVIVRALSIFDLCVPLNQADNNVVGQQPQDASLLCHSAAVNIFIVSVSSIWSRGNTVRR